MYSRDYYLRNKEKYLQWNKEWRSRQDPEELREMLNRNARLWRKKNRKRYLQINREGQARWRAKNPGMNLLKVTRYEIAHLMLCELIAMTRRERNAARNR